MGYFSNGTQWEIWNNSNCADCIHDDNPDKGCPIIGEHLGVAADKWPKEKREVLGIFIPEIAGDSNSDPPIPPHNGKCTMRVGAGSRDMVDEALETAEHYFDSRIGQDESGDLHALYVQMRDARHQRRNHGA